MTHTIQAWPLHSRQWAELLVGLCYSRMVSPRVTSHDSVYHDSVYYDSLDYDAELGGKPPDSFKTPAMRVQTLVKRWSEHIAWNVGDAYHLWQSFKLRMSGVTLQQMHVRSQRDRVSLCSRPEEQGAT